MTEIYEFNYFNSQSSKFDCSKIYFSEMKKKVLGSGVLTRVGRVTGTTHIFSFGLNQKLNLCKTKKQN